MCGFWNKFSGIFYVYTANKLFKQERYIEFLIMCRRCGVLISPYKKIIAKESIGIRVRDSVIKKYFNKRLIKISLKKLSKLSRFYPYLVLSYLERFEKKSTLQLAIKKKIGIELSEEDREYVKSSKEPEALLIEKGWSGIGEYLKTFNLEWNGTDKPWIFNKKVYEVEGVVDPVVAVIVTAYNAGSVIHSCIESLLDQTYKKIQIIIVDDASEDDTFIKVSKYASEYKKIKVIRNDKNIGTYASKNEALKYLKPTVKYITCMDSDDWAHPTKIERQMNCMINTKSIAVLCYWIRFTNTGFPWALNSYPYLTLDRSSLLFDKKYVDEISDSGKVWDNVRVGGDRNLIEKIKLFYGSSAICKIKQPLSFGRKISTSLTSDALVGNWSVRGRYNRAKYFENVYKLEI